MKKILYIFFMIVSTSHFAQGATNPFEESEKDNKISESGAGIENEAPISAEPRGIGGGNPGTLVPIDDYIPLLAATAISIIIYTTHTNRKKNLLSQKNKP